jgi:hypothetical protein
MGTDAERPRSNPLVQRTLDLAQELKLALGGRTSDPVNPNYLTAAALIAISEQDEANIELREDQKFVQVGDEDAVQS